MNTRTRTAQPGLRMPRSRGAVSGLLLVILGAWGALIPFVGPHFNFAYTPDRTGRGPRPGAGSRCSRGRHRGGRPAADRFRKSRRRDVRRLAGGSRRAHGSWSAGSSLRCWGSGPSAIRLPHRTQAGRARGLVFLRPGCADRLPGRDRPGAPRGPAGARRRARGGRLGAPARPANRRCAGSTGSPAVRLSGGRVVARDRRHQAAGGARTRRSRRRRPRSRGGVRRAERATCARLARSRRKSTTTRRRVRRASASARLHQSRPSSRRSLTYLAMIGGVMCGMSLSGPIFASWTAARNRSVGAIDPLIGLSGFW